MNFTVISTPEEPKNEKFTVVEMSPREAVDALPDWLTRTPFEKQNDWQNGRGAELEGMGLRGTRGESAAIGAYDGLSLGNYATERSAKALYPTYANMPFLAQGASALDKQGLLPDWAGGGQADAQEATLRGFQEQQTAAREENPMSYMGGAVGGYLMPGGGVLNVGSRAARGAGAKLLSRDLVPKGQGLLSKGGRYLGGVVAPTSIAGGVDYGIYNATVGESSEAAAEGRTPTLGDRASALGDGLKSWEGYTFGGLASPVFRLGRGAVTTTKNTIDASLDAGKLTLKAGSFTPTQRATWAKGLANSNDPKSRAYKMVVKRLKADGVTPEQLNKAIDNYNYAGYSSVDEMLFELAEASTGGKGGGQIKNLAVALGAVGGDAQQKAREAFRIRREMMPEKFQGSLQRAAGLTGKGETAKEFYDVLDDFAEKQVTTPKPLYEAAYANEVSDNLFISKVLPELARNRDKGVLAEAADYAWGVARTSDELAVAGRIGRELTQLDDDLRKLADGQISAAQVRKPSTQAMDYIERTFADQGRGIRKGTGRTELARGPEGASARLREGIDGTGLSGAREMSARYKTAQEAMEFARKSVSKSTDLETLQREFAKHIDRLDPDAPPDSPTVRAALLMGYIRGADDIITKADNPATAIRQLYGSQRQREKMVAMLTDLDEETKAILTSGKKGDATKRLRALVGGVREDGQYHPGEFERARSQLNSENQIVGNSQTGQRNEAVAAQGGMERLLRQGYSIAKNPGKAVDDVVDLAINRVSKPGIFKPDVNRELGDIMFTGGRDDLKRIVGDLELLLTKSKPKSSGGGSGGAGGVGAVAEDMSPRRRHAQAGNIVIDGKPQRRKDVMRGVAHSGDGQFPVAQSTTMPEPPQRASSGAPHRSGVMDSPLLPLLGVGVAGMGGVAGIRHLTRPQASTDVPQKQEVPQSSGPSLKPNLDAVQKAVAERANETARTQDQAEQQEYWTYLKSKGDGSSIEWNRISEERASELKVTPEDRARGVVRKRLPYAYDVPVSALREAPIEELIDGEWRIAGVLEGAR